ncbi:thioredoxin domain-containing protein [Nitratifractor sp.]
MRVVKTILCSLLIFSAATAAEKEPINALIREESPYLQQHAHNPVHWMPWGKAAFAKAKKENKPIFLSIGYSTCHWCHVMERESFENPEVAKVLNRYFVAVKVDREEKPQIDRYYQNVHRLITRRAGGWPLTILLMPDRKPFFAATYIPREDRYGQTGLLKLLRAVAATWRAKPSEIRKYADRVSRALRRLEAQGEEAKPAPINRRMEREFVRQAKGGFDSQHGGWGGAPKFPRAATLVALLQLSRLEGSDPQGMSMALRTLDAMARGGIYDQVEGGFFRYSTDARWRIPHFEKMLYTNAELIKAYALAARLTGKAEYRRIVR